MRILRAILGERWRLFALAVLLLAAAPLYGQPTDPRGAGTERADADVDRVVKDLIDHLEASQVIEVGPAQGSFAGERGDVHAGGMTALATLALLLLSQLHQL